MKLKLIAGAVLASVVAVSAQAADIEAGKAKAAMCSACHGNDGKAVMPMYPNLAGQNAPYLESALKAYKSGERKGGQAPVMTGMAASLTDADIANLAAYFSSL